MVFPSPKSLAQETALCYQHADRIAHVLAMNTGGDWEGHPQLVIYWLTDASGIPQMRRAHATHGKVRSSVNVPLRWKIQFYYAGEGRSNALPCGESASSGCIDRETAHDAHGTCHGNRR
jgi:hypothetical protein